MKVKMSWKDIPLLFYRFLDKTYLEVLKTTKEEVNPASMLKLLIESEKDLLGINRRVRNFLLNIYYSVYEKLKNEDMILEEKDKKASLKEAISFEIILEKMRYVPTILTVDDVLVTKKTLAELIYSIPDEVIKGNPINYRQQFLKAFYEISVTTIHFLDKLLNKYEEAIKKKNLNLLFKAIVYGEFPEVLGFDLNNIKNEDIEKNLISEPSIKEAILYFSRCFHKRFVYDSLYRSVLSYLRGLFPEMREAINKEVELLNEIAKKRKREYVS